MADILGGGSVLNFVLILIWAILSNSSIERLFGNLGDYNERFLLNNDRAKEWLIVFPAYVIDH